MSQHWRHAEPGKACRLHEKHVNPGAASVTVHAKRVQLLRLTSSRSRCAAFTRCIIIEPLTMSRDTISPSEESASTCSYGVSASVQSIQSMAAAAVQTRASLPTLALQPPDTGHPFSLTRYEAAVTTGGEDENQTPLPTTPGSPQAAATTPVVPPSQINVRHNRRGISRDRRCD